MENRIMGSHAPGVSRARETAKARRPQNLSLTEHHLLEVHAAPEARLFRPDVQDGLVTHNFRLDPGEVLYLELGPQGEAALPKTPLRQELAVWYASMREKSK
jgi:hypothetical protein